MRHALLSNRLPVLALAAGHLAFAAPAAAQSATLPSGQLGGGAENRRVVTFADLTASAGYSNNPLLRSGSSIFGSLSLLGFHGWNSERGSTSVSGFVEDTTYLRGGYGSKVIFRVNAQASRAVNEKVRVYGSLGVSGDVAGQLANRFTTPPVVTPPPDSIPPPDTGPEVFNLSGRQYFVTGQAGASIATSPLSSVSLTAGASHAFFTGRGLDDYTTYQIGVGYNRQVSERTFVGGTVNFQRQDYGGSDYSNVINPVLTFRTQLAEDISATGSVGLLAIYRHRDGESDSAYSPSFTGSICKSGERSQFCGSVSRTASPPLAIRGAENTRTAAITTNFNLSYSRQLGERETMRALVTATRSSRDSVVDNERFRTTYATGLVSYDRRIGNRLYAGISAGARKVFQTGPDPRMDYNGSLFLRYRLGDVL